MTNLTNHLFFNSVKRCLTIQLFYEAIGKEICEVQMGIPALLRIDLSIISGLLRTTGL